MARHGSKKWIVAYDGRIKRSNDRTKKDYFRELKWWDAFYSLYRYSSRPLFCPQCKHNLKPVLAHNEAYYAVSDAIDAEWHAAYDQRNKEYDIALRQWYRNGCKDGQMPIHPDRDYKSYWQHRRENAYRLPQEPIRNVEAYLCSKCRRKHDVKDTMWRSYTGVGFKNNYRWVRREDYRRYKNKVKTIMQRAKYDEDLYDNIPIYKHGWLD